MKSVAEFWSKSISKLPKKFYNFSNCYVINSLANASNMHKWDKTTSSLCLHCNKIQTLGYVVAVKRCWEKNVIIIVMILYY